QAIEGVEVVSVVNRSRESSERVAGEFDIPIVYDSWEELIFADDTDAIVIGTWPYMHCPLTLAALDAGKHVMCEARMAMNAEEAHRMAEAHRSAPDLIAQIVPSPYTLRADKTIRRLIAEGYLGDLLAIEVRAGGQFIDPAASLHWRNDFDLSGYNIMAMGIWYEAIMRWVGDALTVSAAGKTFTKNRKQEDGTLKAVRIPEHIDVVSDMACGAQFHLQVSGVTGHSGAPDAWIFGSNGTLRFHENTLFGGQKSDKGLSEIKIPAAEEGAWRVEEEFINAIRGLEPITHTSFEDGVKYMEFTEAVTVSMQEGVRVHLPL
ncbi:MAG: Gfo/Idh/MocA family oxidoreductase, partial [Litorilinea sp.]